MGSFHDVEYAIDVLSRNLFVKEITHRVYKDEARLLKLQRLLKAMRVQFEIETELVRMIRRSAPPLRETFSVAVVTASADLRATRNRIPRDVSPFDRRSL